MTEREVEEEINEGNCPFSFDFLKGFRKRFSEDQGSKGELKCREYSENIAIFSDQSATLSTSRKSSSIPQSNSSSKFWSYPSPQQFYNALRRKSKVSMEEVDLMPSIVDVHNFVNEKTWVEILNWERLNFSQCKRPSLQRFNGNSENLSLKARIIKILSFGKVVPFDRHDWYVNRCDKQLVHYIIDYYDCPTSQRDYGVHIDVRPAISSFSSLFERVRGSLMLQIFSR